MVDETIEVVAPTPENLPSVPETEEKPLETVSPGPDGTAPIGLWLDGNTVPISIYAYKSKSDGKFLGVFLDPVEEFRAEGSDAVVAEFTINSQWSIPSHARFAAYKRRAQLWEPEAQGHVIDRGILRKCLFRYHLESIDVAQPGAIEKLVLEHGPDRQGVACLSETSEERLTGPTGLHPQVIETLIEKYRILSGLLV